MIAADGSKLWRAGMLPFAALLAWSLLMIGSLRLEWLRVGVGREPETYTGQDVYGLSAFVVVAGVLVTTTLLYGTLRKQPDWIKGGTFVAFAAGVVLALLILFVESIATAVPSALLPPTIRRSTVDLSAGAGLWICASGFLAVGCAAAALSGRPLPTRIGRPHVGLRGAAVLVLVLCTGLFAWLRYQPWIQASAVGMDVDIAAWSLPWLGPLSLVAAWALACGTAVAATLHGGTGALVAATGGWLVTFVAGLSVVATDSLGHVPFAYAFPPDVRPDFQTAPAAWAGLALGAVAAAACATLIASGPRSAARSTHG